MTEQSAMAVQCTLIEVTSWQVLVPGAMHIKEAKRQTAPIFVHFKIETVLRIQNITSTESYPIDFSVYILCKKLIVNCCQILSINFLSQ